MFGDMMTQEETHIHNDQIFFESIQTPAFIYNENKTIKAMRFLNKILIEKECKILFPLKSFSIAQASSVISSHVDGFSASSLFEAKLAKDVLGNEKSIHFTTPGLQPDEIDEISELCDYISFNSLSQWERYYEKVRDKSNCGIRINPQLPFIKDV